MRRKTSWIGGLTLGLALSTGLPAQSILGFGTGSGSGSPAPAPGTPPRATLQDIARIGQPEFELVRASERRVLGLKPRLDTPTIRNEPIPGLAPGGFCYGLLRVAAIWYHRVIRRGAGRDASNPVVTSRGEEVHSGNYREFRFRRRTTQDQAFRTRVARAAIREHRYSEMMGPMVASDSRQTANQRWKVRNWMREIREKGSAGVGYKFVRRDGVPEAHAILLVGMQECRIRDAQGREHSAYRFRFIDPNFVEGHDPDIDPARDFHLYYTRDTKELAFSTAYVQLCRQQGRMLQAGGRVLDPAEIQYLDIHLLDGPYTARIRRQAGVAQAD